MFSSGIEAWQRLGVMLDGAFEGMILCEGDRILAANARALEMLGYADEAALIVDAPTLFERIDLRAERNFEWNVNARSKILRSRSCVGDPGDVWMLYIQDRSDIEAVARQVRKQEEQFFNQSRLAQMGEMISMIAHQWRQPLCAVASAAIALQTRARLGRFDMNSDKGREETLEYLINQTRMIAEYVDTMTLTIEDFRSFYKKDREKEFVSVRTLIGRTLGIFNASLKQQGIELGVQGSDETLVEVFPNEIVQVLLNIIQNSFDQFVERKLPQPRIELRWGVREGMMCIEIGDNAGGIPEHLMGKIFQPYFSTKVERNGTGLGLYMSKTIIQEHHGGLLEALNQEGGRHLSYRPSTHHKGAQS